MDAAEAVRLDRAAMARIALMVGQGSFGTDATIGFVDGFAQGFLAGGVVWKDEVLAYLRILGVGVTLGAAEFFYRPMLHDTERVIGLASVIIVSDAYRIYAVFVLRYPTVLKGIEKSTLR